MTPVTPSCSSWRRAGSRKRSSQHDVARDEALRLRREQRGRGRRSSSRCVDRKAAARPSTPLTRSWSASTTCRCSSRSRPGGSRSSRRADVLAARRRAMPAQRRLEVAHLRTRRRQRVDELPPVRLATARRSCRRPPCSPRTRRARLDSAHDCTTSTRIRTSAITKTTRPSRRRSGADAAAAGAATGAGRAAPRLRRPGRGRRTRCVDCGDCASTRRLVVEEVELDVVVARRPSAGRRLECTGRPGRKRSSRRGEVDAHGVPGRARARPRPRSVPPAPAPRLGRNGPRLARARRAQRPRRRAQDRRARGKGRRARRARGRRGRRAPAPPLPADLRARARPRATSTSPTSTCPDGRCARRCAPGSSTTARARRGRGADPRRRSRTPTRAGSSTAT